MDDKGYLIAHPGLIDPTGKGPQEQRHITHMVSHQIDTKYYIMLDTSLPNQDKLKSEGN